MGFTLIELVIVLAIAALILAGVLVAVGGGQRSQRDTARKNEAGRLASAIANYGSNNDGSVSGFVCNATTYCHNILDVDTGIHPKPGNSANKHSGIKFQLGTDCAGNTSAKSFSIFYWSENSNSSMCTDNS